MANPESENYCGRLYTEAELRLNQAALLRAAAKAIDNIYPDRTRGAADGMLQKCMEVVLAIPTDQLALDRHDAFERAALLREAAAAKCEWCREHNTPVEREEFRSGVLRWHNVEGQWMACYSSAILAIPTDQPALDRYVAERVRDAMREESEWWAARDVLKHPHKHNTKAERTRCAECQRLDAHRAAAGAPEEK